MLHANTQKTEKWPKEEEKLETLCLRFYKVCTDTVKNMTKTIEHYYRLHIYTKNI